MPGDLDLGTHRVTDPSPSGDPSRARPWACVGLVGLVVGLCWVLVAENAPSKGVITQHFCGSQRRPCAGIARNSLQFSSCSRFSGSIRPPQAGRGPAGRRQLSDRGSRAWKRPPGDQYQPSIKPLAYYERDRGQCPQPARARRTKARSTDEETGAHARPHAKPSIGNTRLDPPEASKSADQIGLTIATPRSAELQL
jgi:hypothetical protein